MCRIADGYVTYLKREDRTAAKVHECSECSRQIAKGERYRYERHYFDRRRYEWRACDHCWRASFAWLMAYCGSIVYFYLLEDLEDEEHEDFPVAQAMARAMAVGWEVGGKVIDLPDVPLKELGEIVLGMFPAPVEDGDNEETTDDPDLP